MFSLKEIENDWPAPSTVWLGKHFPSISPVPGLLAGLKLGRADMV